MDSNESPYSTLSCGTESRSRVPWVESTIYIYIKNSFFEVELIDEECLFNIYKSVNLDMYIYAWDATIMARVVNTPLPLRKIIFFNGGHLMIC